MKQLASLLKENELKRNEEINGLYALDGKLFVEVTQMDVKVSDVMKFQQKAIQNANRVVKRLKSAGYDVSIDEKSASIYKRGWQIGCGVYLKTSPSNQKKIIDILGLEDPR
jgi:hypothetical protein